MNAEDMQKELELTAYELAEAERLERMAKALRVKAIRRLAKTNAFVAEAMKEAVTRTPEAKRRRSIL